MQISERLARESGRDYAMRMLKDNIVHLGLEPGSLVSENELASELGLSRGPVREALIELNKVKIVEIYPQRGSMIALIDYDLIGEACFMRETLEIAMAERCCALGIAQEHNLLLSENVKLQQFYIENPNFDKLWELDNEFHRLLFLSANALHIYSLMNSLLVHLDRVRAMSLAIVKGTEFVEDHKKIYEAIAKGDKQLTKELMHKHLTRYEIDKEAIRKQYPQYLKQD